MAGWTAAGSTSGVSVSGGGTPAAGNMFGTGAADAGVGQSASWLTEGAQPGAAWLDAPNAGTTAPNTNPIVTADDLHRALTSPT